jgi:hypothetical protein
MRSAFPRHSTPALVLLAALAVPMAHAKLPAPVLTDEAKAKAAEAAAKTAWSNKVADFQLCKSMDKAAAKYQASMKAAGKEAKPPTETPPCADPGPFVAAPPAAAAPAASAPAAAAAPKKS